MRSVVTGRLALLAVGIAAGLTGCSAPGRGEPESVFRREVAPVLEARCTDTVCHGARSGAEYRREKRLLPDGALVFRVDEQGRLVDLESAREAARGQINTAESAAFSGLLREPLSRDWGGLPHEGGTNFASTRDPGYRALRRWIRSETRGGEDPDFELTDRQEYFAREVQPALVGRNCMAGSCHDLTAFKPTFDPGLPSRGGKPRFSRRMIRRNYRMARHFLALDGHPEQSRLLRKGLPLNEGGIAHRGANRQFFSGPDSRAVRAIERWVKMERRAALKKESREPLGAVEGAGPTGLVYVRGPVESRSPFDIAQFIPGRDLYYRPSLDANDAVDLTGELHDGPADVRAPVVAPDGKHVAFAMRPSESAGFQIWETNLQTREADQLTSTPARLDSGHVAVNTTPVYGPENHVYFVSNRHDVRADSPSTLDYELFAYDRSDGSVERLTHTPSPEIEPTLVQGNPLTPQSAHLVFSYRRSVDHRDDTIGFSLPLDHHVDYHIYFGRTDPVNLLYQFAELPDFRAVAIAGDRQNAWVGGRLAIVDRHMGPDLRAGQSPENAALPGYTPSYRPLDGRASPTGQSKGGLYRDPAAMQDGSILVAHSPSAADIGNPDADVEYRIERLDIDEAPEGCHSPDCMPRIGSRSVVADAKDVSLFDPTPVAPWVAPAETESVLDHSKPARYSMNDPAVNNAISSNLAPSGPRRFRDDIEYLRFVEALPQSPETWHPVDSSVDGAATTSTAGVHMPARILGEVPVAEDGSVYATVPSNTPFRVQYLDKNRMVVGRQHNRWLYVYPGEHFQQATKRELYTQQCGKCHGAVSGNPSDITTPPDVTTSASTTLARYENRNLLEPKDPVDLGEQTRRTVDFASDVQPILDRRCNGGTCHGSNSPAGGVDLSATPTDHYSTAYEELLAAGEGSGGGNRYVDEANGRARTSHLVEIVRGEEFDAPKSIAGHPSVEVPDDEVLTIVRWIETGAHYEVSETDGR